MLQQTIAHPKSQFMMGKLNGHSAAYFEFTVQWIAGVWIGWRVFDLNKLGRLWLQDFLDFPDLHDIPCLQALTVFLDLPDLLDILDLPDLPDLWDFPDLSDSKIFQISKIFHISQISQTCKISHATRKFNSSKIMFVSNLEYHQNVQKLQLCKISYFLQIFQISQIL